MGKIGKMMRDWVQFFLDPSKVSNKDEGMKEAQYIWMKVSGDDEVKARIRAIEKYEMDKGSELATARKQGLIEGEKKGIEKGVESNLLDNLKKIMAGLNYTAQQAMDLLQVPAADRPKYMAKL